MNNIDKHLNHIQEIEPITTTLVIGSAYVLVNLITLFAGASEIIRKIEVDENMTNKINNILKSNEWYVHRYNTNTPSAFSLGFGKHIFFTSELEKILTEKELISVLLHECYHSKNKHTFKDMAFKYPLFYLMTYLCVTSITSTIFWPLALFAVYLVNKISKLAYSIIVSRRMEYNADSYAAKMGYGKELSISLEKISDHSLKYSKSQTCDKWCQLINKIDNSLDEHPSDKKRVENILKHSDKLYKAIKNNNHSKLKNIMTHFWNK